MLLGMVLLLVGTAWAFGTYHIVAKGKLKESENGGVAMQYTEYRQENDWSNGIPDNGELSEGEYSEPVQEQRNESSEPMAL